MKILFTISVFIISGLGIYARPNSNAITQAGQANTNFINPPFSQKDTSVEDLAKENTYIEEVIKSRSTPRKERVQYFNQITRYGFKNLFSNLSYNPSMPYISQINPQAEIFVQDYMRVHGSHLQKMKNWGQPYFLFIENILQQYGLPKELKYIAVIESNLSTSATSSAGAGGPWQFMPYTARQYGLMVNDYIDERRDYLKSTHAAARYLLTLYHDLHDWLLVMAAYNGGSGRVYNAIKRSGSRNFWNLQYYLPEESRTYVKRFIATHYIMEGCGGITTFATGESENFFDQASSRTVYGNNNTLRNNPYNTLPDTTSLEIEVIPISGKFNSLIIAKNISMDIIQFNRYNPNFDVQLASTGNTELRLPPEKMQLFIANKYAILNESVYMLLNDTNIPDNSKTTYPKNKKNNK